MSTRVKRMETFPKDARFSKLAGCLALGLASLTLSAFGAEAQRTATDDAGFRDSLPVSDRVDSIPARADRPWRRVEPETPPVRADALQSGLCGAIDLTQSTDPNTVLSFFSVACFDAGGNCTHETEYARSFDLSVGSLAGQGHFVRCVTYGVDSVSDPSTGFSPLTINLYLDPNGGAPDIANLVLLKSIVDMVPDGTTGALRTVDFTLDQVLVPADATLVVSVLSEDLCSTRGADHSHFGGANNLGQTAPSYIRRPDCGNADFETLANLGNPFQHMVLTVALDPQLSCPSGSQFSQPPVPPTGVQGFHVSDQDAGIQVFDNFSGVTQPIEAVSWWGDQADLTIPDSCIESRAAFDITFYQDNAGAPGAVVCSYPGMSIVPFDTGIDVDAGDGFLVDVIRFGASLPSPCNLASGWISIQGRGGSSNCVFRWASATEPGMGSALEIDGVTPNPLDVDLSLCLPMRVEPCTIGSDTCYLGSADTGVPCGRNSDCAPKAFTADPNLPIPDNDPVGVTDTINVPDSFTVGDVDVDLIVEHTFVGDLIITLEHNATTIALIVRPGDIFDPGFGCFSDNYDIVLDDEGIGGPIDLVCGTDPFKDPFTPTSPPSYTPNDPLSTFDAMNASGDWTLTISDNNQDDLGSLVHWSLHFPTTDNGVCALKSRYATVQCGTGAQVQSIQVTIANLDDALGFDAREDEVWWAGASQVVPNPPNADLVGAPLVCEPPTLNAEVWPVGEIHLFGSPLVPGSLYEIRACDPFGQICSTGLDIETAKWGDVVAPFGGTTQPNFGDINAVVSKFQGTSPSAPDMPRTDLRGPGSADTLNVPNQKVDFADINADVAAFQGLRYPFSVPACP